MASAFGAPPPTFLGHRLPITLRFKDSLVSTDDRPARVKALLVNVKHKLERLGHQADDGAYERTVLVTLYEAPPREVEEGLRMELGELEDLMPQKPPDDGPRRRNSTLTELWSRAQTQ